MTTALQKLENYTQTLASKIEVGANQHKFIVTDSLASSEIYLKENSKLTMVALLTEGWEELKKLKFYHQGKGAVTNFIAINIGKEENKFPFETESIHEVPETKAFYYIKSALFDKSEVKYRGCLIIKPGAQLTDSYLAHNTLMLSPNAKTETIPSLEIEADDVKAGHAATLGQVDEETMHYMKSRGINEREAKDLLIKGFMEAELLNLESEETRLAMIEEVEKYL